MKRVPVSDQVLGYAWALVRASRPGTEEAPEKGIQRLRYDRHEVLLFHVLHDDELRFPFEGMLRIVGLENNDNFPLAAEDVRGEYHFS